MRCHGRHAAERGLRSWLVPEAVPGAGGQILVGQPAGITRGTLVMALRAARQRLAAAHVTSRPGLWAVLAGAWPLLEALRLAGALPGGWEPAILSGGAAAASFAGGMAVIKIRQQRLWRSTRGRALNPRPGSDRGYPAGVSSSPDRDVRLEAARQRVDKRRRELTESWRSGQEMVARVSKLEAQAAEAAAWRDEAEEKLDAALTVLISAYRREGLPLPPALGGPAASPAGRHLSIVRDDAAQGA